MTYKIMRMGGVSAAVVALAGLAGTSLARQETPTRPGETYKPGQPDKDRPARTPESEPMRAKGVNLIPADWIDDNSVRGTGDDKIGEVNDLILARRPGRVSYVLLGHGGVLKIGEKVTAVPFKAFGWNQEKKHLTLPMSAEQIKNAPSLDSGEWRTLGDPARCETICSFFGVNAKDEEPEGMISGDRPDSGAAKADEFPVLRLSDIKSKQLVGNDGRDIGKINDIVLDTNSGRIAFVVVTFGGVLGIGDDRVPVPWTTLDVNKDGRLYAPTMDKEMIRSSPHLTDKEWGELRDPEFGSRVYKHFGKSAPWLERTTGESGRPATGLSDYDRLCAKGTPREISGTITSIDEATPMRGTDKITVLTIRTDANDTVMVHTCPKAYLDSNKLDLKTGDAVKISGRQVEVDGKDCTIATQITKAGGQPVSLRKDDGSPNWYR
jgi:sporulation protein YlmC with PRC-barrel domain